MDKELILLLSCRLDGCWQLLRKHLRTLHRCVCGGPILRFTQHLPRISPTVCTWWSPNCLAVHHISNTPLCMQTATLLCQQQVPQLRCQQVQPQLWHQHPLLPACLAQAALGRAWPSCLRLRLRARPLYQNLRFQPQQQQDKMHLQPKAQQHSLRRRPSQVSARWCAPFMRFCLPAKRACFPSRLIVLSVVDATCLEAALLEPQRIGGPRIALHKSFEE